MDYLQLTVCIIVFPCHSFSYPYVGHNMGLSWFIAWTDDPSLCLRSCIAAKREQQYGCSYCQNLRFHFLMTSLGDYDPSLQNRNKCTLMTGRQFCGVRFISCNDPERTPTNLYKFLLLLPTCNDCLLSLLL